MTEPALNSGKFWKGWALAAGLALAKVLIHLPVLARFGYHHDELYFIACGQHPAFGYVDHAPLVPWLARLSIGLFGESLVGLRLFSVLAGAAAVFLTVLLAKRMGGGRWAQLAAGLAMLIAPVFLRTGNMLCLPAFEPLFWISACYLVVKIVQEDRPRLWLAVGLVAGLGLLNKHTMLFFAIGLVVGLVATPLRRNFRSAWFYLGGIIALAIFLPNLIWQIQNGWPTLHFLVDLRRSIMSGISPLQFLAGQLLYLHPVNAVLWIGGLVFIFSRAGKSIRVLGWIWVSVFFLLLLSKSKIYYLAPAYPGLLAVGSLWFEKWMTKKRRPILPTAGLLLMLILGLVMAPLSLPIFSIQTTEAYIHGVTFGAFRNVYELTSDLRGMFGWEERVAAVAEVYNQLPTKEQVVILASGYGDAGAVEYLGRKYSLPRVFSLAMTYWMWGCPDDSIDTHIVMGWPREILIKIFNDVTSAKELKLENVNPWVNPYIITICRQPKKPLSELWRLNRPW